MDWHTQKPSPWTHLPRLRLPEQHAAIHAWLGHRLTGATPTLDRLLPEAPQLNRLRLRRADPSAGLDPEPPADRPPSPLLPDAGLQVDLATAEGGRVRLELGPDLVGALLARLDPRPVHEPVVPAPPNAHDAGLLAGVVAAALHDLAPGQLHITAVTRPRADAAPWALSCNTLWTVGPHRGELHARIDDRAADALRRAAVREPPPVSEARARRVPLTARFLAARLPFDAGDLAALEPGDVLTFPTVAPAESGRMDGWLDLQGWHIAARLERTDTGRCLRITAEEIPMPDPTDPTPLPDEATARLAALPVTVTVSLGELTLPAADVARLAPGQVVELDLPVGDPVTLRAAGQPLAQGELVDVDGALGVRILRLV